MRVCAAYRGVTRMRNLAKIFVVVGACLVVTDATFAKAKVMQIMSPPAPFVSVSLQGGPVELGTLWGPGPRSVQVQLKARVVANCPYQIAASFENFQHVQGKAVMSPKDLSVAVNGRAVPSGKGRVNVAGSAKPTPSGGADVPLNLLVKVSGMNRYPPGRYNGALVITVTAGS